MSDVLFPDLRIGYDLTRKPMFNTKIMTSVNGREQRTSYQAEPKYEFSLTLPGLQERKGELQEIENFFLDRRGAFDSFLFKMPFDHMFECEFIGDGVTTEFKLYRLKKTGRKLNTIPHYVNPNMWNSFSKNMWVLNGFNSMWSEDYIAWWESVDEQIRIPLSHTQEQYFPSNPNMWNINSNKVMWDVINQEMWSRSTSQITKKGSLILSEPLKTGEIIKVVGNYFYRCRFADDEQSFTLFSYRLWKGEVTLIGSLGNKV